MSEAPRSANLSLASVVELARRFAGKKPRPAELDEPARRAAGRIRERIESLESLDDTSLARRHREVVDASDELAMHELRVALAAAAVQRTHGLVARDNQLLGALGLVRGSAVELPTGEGKTLVGVLAAAALAGRGVHVITPNEYLAVRDAGFASAPLALLGLAVRAVVEADPKESRRRAYRADVTYGAARTVAFDRLRDSVVRHSFERLEPRARAVIVDEIDSVLVDLALLPFVLGDGAGEVDPWPARVLPIVERWRQGYDYEVDRTMRQAWPTARGEEAASMALVEAGFLAPAVLGGESDAYDRATRALRCALEAREIYESGRDYLVQEDGTIVPIERSTGRLGTGRRFAAGLHAALEAKERLPVRGTGRIVAELDVRSFFSSYERLSGMSGTLRGLERELRDGWQLERVQLPPHRPSVRKDDARHFESNDRALGALIDELRAEHERGRPVLVGVGSELEAERVSRRLDELGLPHRTLTARDHANEAKIVADAGREGAITVATQVAGRGTDIRLGDSDQEGARVAALGGLRILALAHARDRRIDDQLRGRAGRGGDPGHTTFFASLEDAPVVENAREDELARLAARASSSDDVAWQRDAAKLVAACQRRGESRAAARREEERRFLFVLAEQRALVEHLQKAIIDGRPHPSDPEADDIAPEIESRRAAVAKEIGEFVARRGPAGLTLVGAPSLGPDEVAIRAAVIDVYRGFGLRTTANEVPAVRREAVEWLTERTLESLRAQSARFVGAAVELAVAPLAGLGPMLDAEDWERANVDFASHFGRRPEGGIETRTEVAEERLARAARSIARERLRAERHDVVLRAFRVSMLSHLAAAIQEHVEETRWLVPSAAVNNNGRGDPAVAFRVETHRRFEERLAAVRRAAASQVLRARERQSPM